MQDFTLRIRDFRVIERLDWKPSGLCVLSGANGVGKTTVLDSLCFLRALFSRGHEAALSVVDGMSFHRLGAQSENPVEFVVEVDDLVWKLRFPMSDRGLKGSYGETIHRGAAEELHAVMFEDVWSANGVVYPRDEHRCCAKALWDRGDAPWMKPLVDAMEGIRVYSSYWLNQVKAAFGGGGADSFLHGTGRNLWSVLANWKASPLRYRGQFDWVMTQARNAFPGLLGAIDFDRMPILYHPGATDPADGLTPNRQPDGLLTGLLHLTAIAGARDHSLVLFDEVENQLHPHAIRSLTRAMRDQADERGLTIMMTTHSPVVLNQFRDSPEQVFVLGHGDSELNEPARMTELHTDEWLAQAKLGSLYERLAFGAPDIPGNLG